MSKAELVELMNRILHDLWMKGVNMGGEYHGVWVRFRDIECIMKKHMEETE